MMKIFCISDTHNPIPDIRSQSLFPKALAKMTEHKARDLFSMMCVRIKRCSNSVVDYLIENSHAYNLVVHLGDVTSGYQEKGCGHPVARKELEWFTQELKIAVNPVPLLFCAGNHDTGYQGSIPGSDITSGSVVTFTETCGDLFWVRDCGILCLGIASPLAEYAGDSGHLEALKKRQAQFVGDTLLAHKGQPWLFFTHSPFAVRHLVREISQHVSNLTRLVHGDFHLPWLGRMISGFGRWLCRHTVVRRCFARSIMCPSTAPLWWPHSGYLSLEINQGKVTPRQTILKQNNHPRIFSESLCRAALAVKRPW